MHALSRRLIGIPVAVVLAVLAGLTLVPPAQAASSGAYGVIRFPQHDSPKVEVRWFHADWTYIDAAKTQGGSYSINLDPGTYHLQFVDQRETWDTRKYAPTDITVTVGESRTQKNVTMVKGAVLTGTAKAKGKVAGKATVTAANEQGQSYSTTADGKGRFAIGGLPAGKYSVFTYDKRKTWVDKSTWAGRLKPGQSKNLAINLKKRGGSLRVFLYTRTDGVETAVTGKPVVTAVSKKTGQWWSVKAKGGNAVFQGLYPGKYTLVANGYGIWFGRTGAIKGKAVRSGKTAFGTFVYTQRGGWVTGTVVDSSNTSIALADASVLLYDADGNELDETTSASDGSFILNGQLATQSGMTVVVQPGPYTDYLGTSSQRCEYQATEHDGVSVTTGEETQLGSVGIDRKTDGTCNAPTG